MEVGQFFNPQTMDMNALYQQDIDLGVDWFSFEPVKSVKEVDTAERKNEAFDLKNFIIDGETGEYLPIQPAQQETQKPVVDDETGQTSNFNIDDFDNFFQTNMNTTENVSPLPKAQPQPQTANISGLPSIIQPTESNTNTINTGLWEDIATLSELSGLTFDPADIVNTSSPMSGHSADSGEIVQFNGMNQFQNDVFGNRTPQVQEQQPNVRKEQYFNVESYHTFPTPPYNDQSESPIFNHPANVTFPPDNDKSFGPADFEETKMTDLLLSEQNDLLAQLDGARLSVGNSPPSTNAEQVSAPGSWFFGGDEPANNFSQVLNELDLLNNMPNQTGPYMNPPNAQFVPPPLGELEMTNQAQVRMLQQSHDSDSGSSLDGFGDGSLNDQQMDIDMFDQETGVLQEQNGLMSVGHNHTYGKTELKAETAEERKQSQRESRDLKKARELNISLSLDQIINSPVEEYNELLARSNFTPAQQTLIRDIRRRGKNKVAAQNCRKRKIETISSMETDIDLLNSKRQSLMDQQNQIERTKLDLKAKYSQLYQQIFHSLRDDSGRLYDPSRFSLEQVEGAIILVPGHRGNRMAENNDNASNRTVAFFDLSKVKIEKQED